MNNMEILNIKKVGRKTIRVISCFRQYLEIDENLNEIEYPFNIYKVQVKLPLFNIWVTIKEFDYGYKPEDEIFAKNEAECLFNYIINPYN